MFSQQLYIDKIPDWFSLQNEKPSTTPLDPHHQLTLTQCPSTLHQYKDMCDVPYREVIGSLMYATLGTHPDIIFEASFLSQFMQNLGWPHWEAIKCVFHYLKGTWEHMLTIGKSGTLPWNNKECAGLEGYCDATGHHRSINTQYQAISLRYVDIFFVSNL